MHSFMALMLIIKMIKVKLMFLLPMIVGQSTAKKLLLKALLFLIPGLAHLFKLCHYYHQEHAKYHHHHHLVILKNISGINSITKLFLVFRLNTIIIMSKCQFRSRCQYQYNTHTQ